MKQLKFIRLFAVALILGATFASCNDDNNDIVSVAYDFVRVNDDMPLTFTNITGTKLIPNQSILPDDIENDMAMLSYQYDQSTIDETSNSLNINIIGSPYYFKTDRVEEAGTVTPNAPIATLTPSTYYGITIAGGFFDKNTLILPIGYKIQNYASTDPEEEANAHSFVLTYDPATAYSGGTLTLYLHHVIDESLADKIRDYDVFAPHAFNIAPALEGLTETPQNIKVVIRRSNQSSFDSAYEYTYTYEYSSLFAN